MFRVWGSGFRVQLYSIGFIGFTGFQRFVGLQGLGCGLVSRGFPASPIACPIGRPTSPTNPPGPWTIIGFR